MVAVTELYENLGGLKFGMTDDGQPGYKKDGADTVYPFNSGPKLVASYNNLAVSSKEYSITEIVPDYRNKTADDFFLRNVSFSVTTTASKSISLPLIITYNNETGIVTVNGLKTQGANITFAGYTRFDLYVC